MATVVNHDELKAIFSIISPTKEGTLESCWVLFSNSFAKADYFRLCCGMATLYVDGVLSKIQRLVVVFLLYAVHRNEQENHNQFLILLDEQAVMNDAIIDRWLMTCMIKSSDVLQEVGKKTCEHLIGDFSAAHPQEISRINIAELISQRQQVEPPELSNYETSAVRSVIYTPDVDLATSTDGDWTEEELMEESNILAALDLKTYQTSLVPTFMKWAPPSMEVMAEELQWMNGDSDAACIVWDNTLTKSLGEEQQLREAFSAALSNPLSPVKQQMLANKLKDKPGVPTVATPGRSGSTTLEYIVSPQQLPLLIENNSAVAVEYILKMMQTPQVGDYLAAIVSMEMSFHSIEVVNGLSTVADFSSDFIRSYISKCLVSCENTKDKFIQSRFVRLVCVLVQSLLRRNVAHIKSMFPELQAFCLSFSKIKEAVLLYKLIKSLEGN